MSILITKGRITDRLISHFKIKNDRGSRTLINSIIEFLSSNHTSSDFSKISHGYNIISTGDITLLKASEFLSAGVTRFDITNRTTNSSVRISTTNPDVFTMNHTSLTLLPGENVTFKVYQDGVFNIV